MANITIMGAGSWGLGLAILLNNNGHQVTVWSVFPDEVTLLNQERENKKCLPGVHISESIQFEA
ncbi:MAG: glycerol-3-phosphate dehydrogenase, partial [Lachnospira sp.]|nr:glycerol-3-phosphate dehydrogenase [Lachnospira sp.]